jgi:hypothetical protein
VIEQADIGRKLENFINPGYAAHLVTRENVGAIVIQFTFPSDPSKKYWIFK